jgi:hypothetical protein
MTLRQATFDKVCPHMLPGDVIAFAGRGPVSAVIQSATRSEVSHVGVILPPPSGPPEGGPGQLQVCESTSLDGFAGVTIHALERRIEAYDGEVWWLPLDDQVRERMDLDAFCAFLERQEGRPYDLAQAVKSGLDQLDRHDLLLRATYAREDSERFFCSELVAAAFEASGAISHLNSSEVTPIDLCMFNLYKPVYIQLRGEPTLIAGYNTLAPEGFGE